MSQFFQNVALYGYFKGGKRLPAPDSGNILVAAFSEGWCWYIPLSDELTSVGFVVSREAAESLRDDKVKAFEGFLAKCPIIKDHLSAASRITEGPYGQLRVRKDYSYCSTAFYRNGLALVGDAACFVDPVLSSGVHLATYSALLAARSINTALDRKVPEAECFAEFEFRYRREFGNFYRFLSAFYDMHRDERSYYWEARKTLDSEEDPHEAFVRLVAGLGQEDDMLLPHPESPAVRSRLGKWFETRVSGDRLKMAEAADVDSFDFDSFLPGISNEITQMQVQAFLGDERAPESPLRGRGLTPSPDGFHWARPA